ncbi:hypothetical protein AYK24_06650 [Thermoplasmatales archaeon SG8-52-4]|nr:MAG: hypothetical protein AYK24_06650 [Thermoplasmatales archaeon SG8-52-4]
MDIIQLLDNEGIPYWTSGKNVSKGWVNIQCPFCSDRSNHLGIRKRDLRVHCWQCKGHSLRELIVELVGNTHADKTLRALRPSSSEDGVSHNSPPSDVAASPRRRVWLPREATKYFPEIHKNYLKNRGFNPRTVIRKYQLRACYKIGKYKFRIIIPIFLSGKLVCFTSRGIIEGMDGTKYMDASPEECLITTNNLVYNYDNLQEGSDAIHVEGPIDVWKLGDGAISFMGLNYSMNQIKLIMKKKIHKYFILLDPDTAGNRAIRRLAREVAPLVGEVHIVKLKIAEDPGALTITQGEQLKSIINFQEGRR